jgi:phage host-nuclease inhibitor protein Gam
MPDTSETNSVDREPHEPLSDEHYEQASDRSWMRAELKSLGREVRRLHEVVDHAYLAHEAHFGAERVKHLESEIERLQAVVADQALTIGTLKDELGKSHADREDWCAEANRVLGELGKATQLLSEERSLTAATAAHTTALERRVAELQAALEPLVETTVDEWVANWRAFKKPGAAT